MFDVLLRTGVLFETRDSDACISVGNRKKANGRNVTNIYLYIFISYILTIADYQKNNLYMIRSEIGFVVIHYGEEGLLEECLRSIKNLGFSSDFITVINNNNNNLGFASGVNKGVCEALKNKKIKYIFILNNDISFVGRSIEPLIKCLNSPNIGIASPTEYISKNKYLAGGIIDSNRFTAGHGLTVVNQETDIKIFDFVSGSCMLVRRDVFENVGWFDDRFFMYYEDVDFCFRANKQGYKSALVSSVAIKHRGSSSIDNLDKEYYLARNHLLFVEKHSPWRVKAREITRFPKTIFEHFVRHKKGKAALEGILDYFIRSFGIRKKL